MQLYMNANNLFTFLKTCIATVILSALCATSSAQKNGKPNIIVILTDDMGYGDISCFNGAYKTPNIDQIAAKGRKFINYYSASPICSPSRAGLLTGTAPAKWNITSFLQKKADNKLCEQADFLRADAPSVAKILHDNGYATGHFGKWHMGGGRDVGNAPSIRQYGFDEYSSTWESPDPDPLLTATDWIWSDKDSIKRWNRTAYFVDKTLMFLKKHKGQPCYINLWPDDVHTPWIGGDDKVGKYPGGPEEEKSFVTVLNEYDRQMGRLMSELKKSGMDDNTIIIFTSDNGPLPNFRNDRSAGMRGSKLSLYEGGIKMPFIARWPGHIPAGTQDTVSVLCATDLLPTICSMAGVDLPENYHPDGEDKITVLLGKPATRKKEIYWEYGRNETSFKYPGGKNRSPSLAIRDGNWKLLMNKDESKIELYDMLRDKNETTNKATENKAVVEKLSSKLLNWWNALPALNP